jgi:hypothetical protein
VGSRDIAETNRRIALLGVNELTAAVAAAGIARPPLGAAEESSVNSYGKWSWGSVDVPPHAMYMFEFGVIARMLAERGPFFAFSHAGHGVNSYGLSLVTAVGPIAAFVQHAYGGVYSNPVDDLIAINSTYSRLHVLFNAAKRKSEAPLRWMMVYSDFRGICDIHAIGKDGGSSVLGRHEKFDGEEALFKAATDLLKGQGR